MTKQVNEQVGGREIWKIATSTSLNRVHPYYHISSHRGFRKKPGKIICFASRNGCTETRDIQRGSVFVREVQMNDFGSLPPRKPRSRLTTLPTTIANVFPSPQIVYEDSTKTVTSLCNICFWQLLVNGPFAENRCIQHSRLDPPLAEMYLSYLGSNGYK